jgi:hypothetical protein
MRRLTRYRIRTATYVVRASKIRFYRNGLPGVRAATLWRFLGHQHVLLNSKLSLPTLIKAAASSVFYAVRDRPRMAALEEDGFYWSSDIRIDAELRAFWRWRQEPTTVDDRTPASL